MKKRTVALLLALVLVLGIAAGGTVAWLVANSGTVANTFTLGDINITLDETTGSEYPYVPGDDDIAKDPRATVKAGSEAAYLFVKVEVKNNSCTDSSGNVASPIVEWTVADGWTYYGKVDGDGITKPAAGVTTCSDQSDGVYYFYRPVNADTVTAEDAWTEAGQLAADQAYYILSAGHADTCEGNGCTGCGDLANGHIEISEDVTKEMVSALGKNGTARPQLIFSAAAVQYDNIADVDEAFAQINWPAA